MAPGRATDANVSTRWSSEYRDNQWWQVDLGRARLVDRVHLRWEYAYASRYRILTSTDGQNFVTAAEVTLGGPVARTTSFTARQARYVRVVGLQRATPYGISLWEAEVYGPVDQTVAPPAPPTGTRTAPPTAGTGGTKPKPPRRTSAVALAPAGRILALDVRRRNSIAAAVNVSGRVAASHGRVALGVERFTAGRWKSVTRATARLRRGRFARVFRVRAGGRYRVRAKTHGGTASASYKRFAT